MPIQDDEIILSPAKFKELEEELEHLQTTGRREIAERIKDARSLGNLRENFDYEDAKRQQGMLEARIVHAKRRLECAKVLDTVGSGDIVGFNSVVKVHDEEFDEDVEYTIVGVMEADPTKNLISNKSSIGTALLGHKIGDRVDVKMPNGPAAYKILSVH